MNILFLFARPIIPHMGGVQRVTYMLAQEFLQRGHKVVFLSTVEDPEVCNYNYIARQYFIDCMKCNEVTIKEKYCNILKEEKIDIIINQGPRPDTHFLLSITPKEKKKITCIHIQPFFTQTYAQTIIKHRQYSTWKGKLYNIIHKFCPRGFRRQTREIETARFSKALAVSDFLCLLSERFIPRVQKYMPQVDKKKLIAVNNPAKVLEFNIEECKKEKIILWVGRQENAQKNIPAFIDVWQILSKRNKEWRTVIVGDGYSMKYNKEYAKKKKVERLEFAGRQQNVAQFYKKASFIGMTSTYEGWGMVLTEAMSYGCVPFVYDTYESLHDIIDDGKNGIIAQPFNKEEMAQRIQELIDNNDKFRLMQQESIKKVKLFSIENIVDKWETFFNL